MSQMHAIQATRATSAPTLRWACDFAGVRDSIREARRWARACLPPCEAQDDIEQITHELAMNAVQHTASGAPGGTFGVDLSWWRVPGLVRVVVEDRGGPSSPHVIQNADGERNRGLQMVSGLADGWGVAGSPAARWVWADVPWAAGGGQPPAAPSGEESLLAPGGQESLPAASGQEAVSAPVGQESLAREELAVLRHALAPARIWLDPSARMWCAWPGTVGAPTVRAPSPRALAALLPPGRPARPGGAIQTPA